MASEQAVERLVADRYALVSPIARGGMGRVWRARDTVLDREVAVKEVELPPRLTNSEREALRARVLREARAAARLHDPVSVTVYDVVEDDGRVHLVLELVDARNLSQVVTSEGPLSPELAAAAGVALLGALAEAHREGIVHRDVKPSNVMLLADGSVRLTDFGIASIKDDPSITATGMVLGSPSYMAPEQVEGAGSGPATDLWGLGATLYFAVEGESPFGRGEPLPTMHAVVHETPRPAARAGALRPVLEALLAKAPGDRPSLDEARRRLAEVAAGELGTTEMSGRPDATATEMAPLPATHDHLPHPSDRKARPAWLAPALVALVALVVGGLTLAVARSGDGNEGGRDAPASGTSVASQAASDARAAGWETYTDDATGYRIAHPPEWRVVRDGRRVDFRDPATGAYLRVDWVRPPGSSPVGAWQQQSRSFAARYSDYEEIRIEPTTFKGMRGAIWEFTYSGQRAIDLGFVTDEYGFALNFQTPAGRWASMQDIFEQFQESFEVP